VREGQRISGGLKAVLAIAAGLSVANIYYNQTLVGVMSQEFNHNLRMIHLMPAATQLGYALGLLLLVPLGDAMKRRELILWQTGALIVSLGITALAPSAFILLLASIFVGAAATVAQQIIPLAAEMAQPHERGKVVGTVMSGLLAGILLARTVSGFVGAYLGWRGMYVIGALIAVLLGIMLFIGLPGQDQQKRLSYPELMLSIVRLTAAYPALRWSVMRQGALFAAFSAFWTILALFLYGPPYHMGSDFAGLFGIIGLVGVLVAPIAGRIADTRGHRRVIVVGEILVLAGFAIFMFYPTLVGLGGGIVLMDGGVQMAMVANQSVIFALNQEARNRSNTIYMTGMFLWGAVGSVAASIAWDIQGWFGVSSLGLILGFVSLCCHLLGERGRRATLVKGGK
jgi:predicted MFS family arabinose efflux permease